MYYVRGTDANGCSGDDSVRVIVDNQRIISGSIGRAHRVMAGSSIVIPITIEEPIASGTTDVTIEFGYREDMVRIQRALTVATMLEGWSISDEPSATNAYRVRAIAPAGAVLSGTGVLLNIELRAYLADSISTELTSIVELNDQTCETIRIVPGRVTIDSICGLDMRLIEPATFGATLAQSIPNPATSTARIPIWLARASHVRLDVFNSAGVNVATLLDRDLADGTHEVLWDVSRTPSGVYYYRLVSDQSSTTRRVIVAQ